MDIESAYKIDKDRLIKYYIRIKNQNKEDNLLKNIAEFLNYQSIGNSIEEVLNILKYFEDKVIEDKDLMDLAFEWIRAQKIRLEYKKYLIRAQYPENDLGLAVDDCIYRFFLDYDKYIRKLFKIETREHNFSGLYEIFFSPFERKSIIIDDIIKNHLQNIPTHYCESKKINTRIITLRAGLTNIIVKDYEEVLFSRKEEERIKQSKSDALSSKQINKTSREFNGTNIERILKTYGFNKIPIESKALENSVTNFLNSYFEFGIFFKFNDFKDLLICNLTEYIYSGLIEKLKEIHSIEIIKRSISETIEGFQEIHKIEELDGLAWTNDLKPVLIKFLGNFCDNLFK